jgi:hypothetical protein
MFEDTIKKVIMGMLPDEIQAAIEKFSVLLQFLPSGIDTFQTVYSFGENPQTPAQAITLPIEPTHENMERIKRNVLMLWTDADVIQQVNANGKPEIAVLIPIKTAENKQLNLLEAVQGVE